MHPTASRSLRLLGGALVANLLGWAATALYAALFKAVQSGPSGVAQIVFASAFPNLLIVPMAMGIVAAYFWRPLALRIWGYLLAALLTVVLCIAGAYLFLKEGAVCLLIVSPVLWMALFAGLLIGRILFRKMDGKLPLVIFPILLVVILAEGKIAREGTGVVTDRIIIAAPPVEVWKHVVSFPPITAAPRYWLNAAGLPSAVETRCEGAFVGAKRECIFSNGLVFQEVVAQLEPGRLLTFDVTEQPADPELLGHVTLHRGQFELVANGDGSSTLIGRSWYTLHVRPLWYFDWWTRDITRQVHLRVMNHIRELSESPR